MLGSGKTRSSLKTSWRKERSVILSQRIKMRLAPALTRSSEIRIQKRQNFFMPRNISARPFNSSSKSTAISGILPGILYTTKGARKSTIFCWSRFLSGELRRRRLPLAHQLAEQRPGKQQTSSSLIVAVFINHGLALVGAGLH